jgi:hypothetical protein
MDMLGIVATCDKSSKTGSDGDWSAAGGASHQSQPTHLPADAQHRYSAGLQVHVRSVILHGKAQYLLHVDGHVAISGHTRGRAAEPAAFY